jgi:hypothetical protein
VTTPTPQDLAHEWSVAHLGALDFVRVGPELLIAVANAQIGAAAAIVEAHNAALVAARAETLREVGKRVVVFGNRLQNEGFTADMLPSAKVEAAHPEVAGDPAIRLLREVVEDPHTTVTIGWLERASAYLASITSEDT